MRDENFSRKITGRRSLLIGLIGLFCLIGLSEAEATELTLEQALEIAFTKSPDMRRTQLSLESSQHNLEAQQAGLKSQFDLTLRPFRQTELKVWNNTASKYVTEKQTSSMGSLSITQPIKWTDGTLGLTNDLSWLKRTSTSTLIGDEEPQYENNLFLSYNQPLFTYNRTKLRLKELELSLENAVLNHALQKLQIETIVTEQFLGLYRQQRSLQISQEELNNSTESYDIITSKVEAGISAREELFQAELTKSNARASVQNNEMSYANSLDNFKVLLGLKLSDEITLNASIAKMTIGVDQAAAIEHGLKNRMELRQRDIDIQNAMHDLIRTGAENEFRASLEFTYGLIGTDTSFGDVFSDLSKNQTIGLTINVPLFDWGKKKHQLAASEANVERTRINADEQRKNIVTGIRRAYRNLINQETQIDIAEQSVKNARLTYEINLERYKNGDLSSKDISFYQTQLSNQQLNEVVALINYQIALLDIKTRTLFDFQKNEPVILTNQEL